MKIFYCSTCAVRLFKIVFFTIFCMYSVQVVSASISFATADFPKIYSSSLVSRLDTTPVISDSISFESKPIQRDSFSISFVGDANLQSIITNGTSNIGTGGLGIIIFKRPEIDTGAVFPIFKEIRINASINIATTLDTFRLRYFERFSLPNQIPFRPDSQGPFIQNISQIGSFLLMPSVTKQSAFGSFVGFFNDYDFVPFERDSVVRKRGKRKGEYRSKISPIFGGFFRDKNIFKYASGMRFVVGGANANFLINSTSSDTVTTNFDEVSLTAFYFRSGFFYDFMPKRIRDKSNSSIKLGIDFSNRWIFGDLAQERLKQDRQNLFGTQQRWFFGYEPYFSIKLRNIEVEASLPTLFRKKTGGVSEDFPGLTLSRLTTNLRFVGGFPIKLD